MVAMNHPSFSVRLGFSVLRDSTSCLSRLPPRLAYAGALPLSRNMGRADVRGLLPPKDPRCR